MSLRVAVQMDPLESINIAGDSSFALMLSAQARGARLWHYDVRSLAWENGRITAWARPVRVQRIEGEHYGFEGDEAKIDLAARGLDPPGDHPPAVEAQPQRRPALAAAAALLGDLALHSARNSSARA